MRGPARPGQGSAPGGRQRKGQSHVEPLHRLVAIRQAKRTRRPHRSAHYTYKLECISGATAYQAGSDVDGRCKKSAMRAPEPRGRAGPGAGMNLAGRCTLSAFLREVFMTCLRVPSRFSPWLAMVLALGCGVARAQFTGMPSGNGADPGRSRPMAFRAVMPARGMAIVARRARGRRRRLQRCHRSGCAARPVRGRRRWEPSGRLHRGAGQWHGRAPGTAGSAPQAMGGSVRPAMAGWGPRHRRDHRRLGQPLSAAPPLASRRRAVVPRGAAGGLR